jgi:hypothetical protein
MERRRAFSSVLLLLLVETALSKFEVTVENDPLGIKLNERVTMTVKADEDLDRCWSVSKCGEI